MNLADNPVSMPAWASALAGLAALALAIGIGRFAFTPILPMMQEDFGLSVSEAGWLASANYTGYLVGALSAIGLRLQSTVAIRAGLLVIGLSTLAMGLDHPFILSIVLLTMSGIASAWVLVFVSNWALERLALLGRSKLSGTVYAGVGTGIVIAGGACLVLMSLHARSGDAWLSLGVISIADTVVIWPLLKASPPRYPVSAPTASGIWSAEYRRLVLCYGAFGFGYVIPATFLPAMAKEIIPDPQLFGWAWPVFGAAAVISTVFAAQLERFLSHRSVWIVGHLVMALGVVIPLFLPGLWGIMMAALLVGGTFMVITMAGMQEARRVAGPYARALMAAMTSAFALGQILGPVIVSLLVRSTGGFAPALVLAASMLALSAISLQRKEKERE
ncbi:MAG TPA: YbfB/YjiJ family MFS transporter [Burkholderiales bacterium]|nr:YbfB/YjiJ family MFS transporter [Burkholderiales bacterium]